MSLKSDTQGFDISRYSAAVIGCGGLGSNVCVHLAGAGIGELIICDFDSISESNLNRQFVYKYSDIGKNKPDNMESFLKDYAPGSKITKINRKILKTEDLDFAENCDIMIIAADNVEVRKIADEFCHINNIPFINGGINGFYGICYLCIPFKTPCLECAGLLNANKRTFSVSSTAGIIGSLCVTVAEKFLTGDDTLAGKLLVLDNEEITQLTVKSSSECRFRKREGQL